MWKRRDVGLVGELAGQDHLERDGAVEAHLPRLEDDAHAAAGDLADELVIAEVTDMDGLRCYATRRDRPAEGVGRAHVVRLRRQVDRRIGAGRYRRLLMDRGCHAFQDGYLWRCRRGGGRCFGARGEGRRPRFLVARPVAHFQSVLDLAVMPEFHLELKESLSLSFVSFESPFELLLRLLQLLGSILGGPETGFSIGEFELLASLDPNFEGLTLLRDCGPELLLREIA